MNNKGSMAINEIVEKIRTGEYRMMIGISQPLQRRNSMGEWTPCYKYHRNTVRAASRKLVRKYDETLHMGFMVCPAA